MNLRIKGKTGAILNFSPDWKIELSNLKTRNMAEQAVYLDGAANIGTNRYDSIRIKLMSGLYKYIAGSVDKFRTPEDYFSYIMAFLREESPFQIFEIGAGRDNRYLDECWLGSGRGEVLRRADLAKSFELEIEVLNPFWLESATQYSGTVSNMSNFTLTNAGDYETYPIIHLTATVDNPALKIINLSDQNRRFELNYPFFLAGQTVVIDSYNNRAMMGNQVITEYTNGNFIRMLAGTNNIRYIGTDCNITVDWLVRRAY